MSISRPRCWIVGVHPQRFPGNKKELEEKTSAAARAPENKHGEVDWFWWPSNQSRFSKEAKTGDLVILIWSENYAGTTGNTIVYAHAQICKITQQLGVRAKAYHAVWPADYEDTALTWKKFGTLVSRAGWDVALSKNSCRELPTPISRRIGEMWLSS